LGSSQKIAAAPPGQISKALKGLRMIEGFTKRDIVIGAIVLIVATALTIEGTY